jgi:hypothetical protein
VEHIRGLRELRGFVSYQVLTAKGKAVLRLMSREWTRVALTLGLLLWASSARAHPVPFSYLDLLLEDDNSRGTLVVHIVDAAQELGVKDPYALLDRAAAETHVQRLGEILAGRLLITGGSERRRIAWTSIEPLPDRQSLKLGLQLDPADAPGVVEIQCLLFPYDPNHQTFVNLYERGSLTHQAILDTTNPSVTYYSGTRQGTFAVIRRFVPAGIHHIAIGPDHILFLIGLLLLGGSVTSLVKIVTSFTIGHSITLSLAALDLFSPSPRVIEPAIALSIVYVGADNLLVSRESRDVRAWVALLFGLVHGFGFAYVLKQFGLPTTALAWSLFSFNVGVEIGQLVIVALVATTLTVVYRYSQVAGHRVAVAGSVFVICAGAFWFVERVFY